MAAHLSGVDPKEQTEKWTIRLPQSITRDITRLKVGREAAQAIVDVVLLARMREGKQQTLREQVKPELVPLVEELENVRK